MREAECQDWWRRVYAVPRAFSLGRISYRRVAGIGSDSIEFQGPVSVICGANGVGKSTLLDTIVSALDQTRALDRSLLAKRMRNSEVEVQWTIDDVPIARRVEFDEAGTTGAEPGLEVFVLDAGRSSRDLISWAASEKNLTELLESHAPKRLERRELDMLSYLVGKTYSSIEVVEIDEFEEVFPYFQVSADGHSYGSETMGLGEMALFLLYWQLTRAPEGSLVLLEEPESFIAPKSQTALMNFIACESVRRKLWVIATTHSPNIVSSVPRAHAFLLYREAGRVGLIPSPSDAQLAAAVGVPVASPVIVLVEDRVSELFLVGIARRVNPAVPHGLDVRICGSHGDIAQVLKHLPRGGRSRLFGVFDGDRRGAEREYKSPHAFLPGTHGPERALRSIATGRGEEIGRSAGVDGRFVTTQLAALEGANDHEWLSGLARELGMTSDHLAEILLGMWWPLEDNAEESRRLILEILGAE